jgi:hypothetical protein
VVDLKIDTEEVDGSSPFGPTIYPIESAAPDGPTSDEASDSSAQNGTIVHWTP